MNAYFAGVLNILYLYKKDVVLVNSTVNEEGVKKLSCQEIWKLPRFEIVRLKALSRHNISGLGMSAISGMMDDQIP